MIDTTNTKLDIPTVDLEISMGKGLDRDAWFIASIPLEAGYPEKVEFRCSNADKDMIANSVISLLERWRGKVDD